MPANPLVTVVIPCYNYGRFLSDALESIRAQTYEAWECLVVDDGSVDNTRDLATRYAREDARIRYLFQQNSGVSAARNTALHEARGTYIQLLDADDLIEREKLALQVAFLEAQPDVDLVYSSIVSFKEAEKDNPAPPRLLQKAGVSGSGDTLLQALVDDNIFLPGCVLFRKTLYDAVGDFRKGIEGIEDWDFFYRAALLHGSFYHDTRTGTRLLARNHGVNASANSFKMLVHKIRARKGLMQNTAKLLQNDTSVFSKTVLKKAGRRHKGLLSRDQARLHLYYGNLLKGIACIFKHAFYSKKAYFAFYDGAYWIKERFKNAHKGKSDHKRLQSLGLQNLNNN